MDFLTSDEQNSISEIIFEKIKSEWCKKIDELANFEKEIEVSKANAAQNKFLLEKELLELRNGLEEESQQKVDTQNSLSTLKEQVTQQTENLENANAQVNALQQQLQKSKSDQEATTERCSSVTANLESKAKLNEELKEQLKALEEQLSSAQRSKCDALIKAEEANASQLQIQFKERRYEQEKSVLSRQLEIFQEQLEKRSDEVLDLRRDHSKAIVALQGDYSHASEEARSLRDEKECLVKENNAKAEKIQELLKSLNETRESGAQLDATYRKELAAQQKMTNIYKAQSDSQQKHSEKLEIAVQELKQLLQEASEQYGTLEKAKIQAEKEAEQALDEKDLLIKDLKEELSKVNELLKYSTRRDDDVLSEISPAASAASQLMRKGLTLSQLYTEYLNTSEKLFRAEEENKRMTRYVEQILREIEEKAPFLRKQKEDYERALETINVLHTQIDDAIYDLEKQKLEASEAQRRSNFLSRENEHLNQQVKDLSKQVAVLLTHVEAARAGLPPPPLPNFGSIHENGNANDVIDQHLVTFRDVSELQEQNKKLLASLRDLTDKIESAEKTAVEAKTQELKEELDMAHKELKDLKSARERTESLVENITRQRDMYRTVLNERSPKTSHSSKLRADSSNEDIEKLESDLEKARNDLEKLKNEHEEYKQERDKNEQLERNEMVKLRSLSERTKHENIRLLSQAEYNDERLKTLQGNCEVYHRQVNALEEKSETLHGIIGRHEGTIDTLREQTRSLTKKLAHLEVQTATMKEDKTLLKESEARLLAERESLHRSQFSQSLLLNNLEAIKNNLNKHDVETRMRFENKISDLTEENCHLKAKIESNLALKEAHSKVTVLEEQLQSLKEELNKAKKALSEAEKNVREFKTQIEEMHREKSRFGGSSPSLNRNRSVNSLQTSPTTSKCGSLVTQTVKELQLQLTEERSKNVGLQTQLEQTQAKLTDLKDTVDQQGNEIKESALSYKVAQDEITSLRKSLEESQSKIKDQEEKLNSAAESEKALKESMDSRLMQLTEDLEERENELEEVQKNFEDAKRAEENASEEMKKQTKLAIEMQNKYEREVMLHGADLQAMSSLKTKLTDHTSHLEEAAAGKLKAEETLSEFRAAQEDRSKLAEKLTNDMRTRVEELEIQNKSLLDQFTNLSDQLSQLQSKLLTTSAEGANISFSEDEARSSEQLLEIIKFLRKEREVADGKVGVLQAESSRLEAQKKCLEDQVALLNKHLLEERERNQSSVENAGKYAEMTRKIQTLDALSDSNRILRQEKDSLRTSLEELEAKISSYESQILPLQEELREAKTKLENILVEKKAVETEKENYKKRSQELVEKLNKARPEDVIKLQQEVQTLEIEKQEKDAEFKRLKHTLNALQATHKTLIVQKNQNQQKFLHVSEENHKLGEEKKKLAVEKVKMNQQYTEALKTNKSHESTIQNLQDMLQQDKQKSKESKSQLLQQILEIRQKEESARRELETSKKNLELKVKEIIEMDEKLNEKKKQINILQKQSNQLRQVAKKYKSQVESKPGLFEPSAAGDEMEEKMILKTSDVAPTKKEEPNKLQEQVTKLQNEVQKKNEELNSIKTHEGGYVAKLQEDLDAKIQELEKANMNHAQLREKMTSDLVEMSKKLGESQMKQSVSQNRIQILEKEKEQLNQQIENLNKRLSILQKMMDHQKQTTVQKLSPNVINIEKASDPPPTANIKPMAAPVPTPAVSSPRSQGSAQGGSSRSIPTASIRPMAPTSTPVSQTSSSVVVVPPMDSHSGDGAVSSTVTLPQATVTPTPVASASTTTQAFPSTLTATVSPTPVSQSSIASTSLFIQSHHSSLSSRLEEPTETAAAPSPSGSADALISQAIALVAPQVEERSMSGQKRKLNVMEREEEEEEEEPDDAKRARYQEAEQATEMEAEELEEMQQEEDMGEPSSSSSHPAERKGDEEILVVSSDEEGQVPSSQSDNVVDENQEENANEGSREAEAEGSEENIIPSSSPSLQPPPRPIHEPPSSSSRQSLALFHQLPNYEEGVDDRIVPSTPTLCVSRPCEGTSGDGVSSPQVPSQGFEFSSSAEEGPDGAAPSTEGLSQIAEGGIMDVTRMDLAQLDDATQAPAASVSHQSSTAEANAEGNISSSADDSGVPEEVSHSQSSPAAAAPSFEGMGEGDDMSDRNDYVVSSQDVVECDVEGREDSEEEEDPESLPQDEEEEEEEEEGEEMEDPSEERIEATPARETRSTAGQGRSHAQITWGGAPSRPSRGSRGQAAHPSTRVQMTRSAPRARRSRPNYK